MTTPSTRSHQWEPEELLRLAELCEKASAGTWSLSEEVCRALAGPNGNYAMRDVTQSIDAAMTLVPPDMAIELERFWICPQEQWSERWECSLENESDLYIRAGALSGPLALCAAALRAAALRARASTPPEGHNGE